MWNAVWPIVLIVSSNIAYNIITKSTPGDVNPFLSLAVTYFVGIIASLAMYFAFGGRSLIQDISRMNWTSWALGLTIIGLEAGYIYLYRAGWKISAGALTANIALAAALIIIGILFYGEKITPIKAIGVLLCVGGLALINL